MQATYLIKKHSLISDQIEKNELKVILDQLEKILTTGIVGEVVEFGCYTGTTSLFIQRLLQAYGSCKQFHVYDSFAGLPEKTSQDESPAGEQFQAGELLAVKQQFIRNFKQAHLPLPVIHKAWFKELKPDSVPDQIAFAFLDGDYYGSIQTSLKLIEGKLAPGAVIIIDDYQSESLPGAKKAVDEWVYRRYLSIRVVHSLAIILYPA